MQDRAGTKADGTAGKGEGEEGGMRAGGMGWREACTGRGTNGSEG